MNTVLEDSATRGEGRIPSSLKRKILLVIAILVILTVSGFITYRMIFDAGVAYAQDQLRTTLDAQKFIIVHVTNTEGQEVFALVQIDGLTQFVNESVGSVLQVDGKVTGYDLSFLAQGE